MRLSKLDYLSLIVDSAIAIQISTMAAHVLIDPESNPQKVEVGSSVPTDRISARPLSVTILIRRVRRETCRE